MAIISILVVASIVFSLVLFVIATIRLVSDANRLDRATRHRSGLKPIPVIQPSNDPSINATGESVEPLKILS
jgi:hypothetical protein